MVLSCSWTQKAKSVSIVLFCFYFVLFNDSHPRHPGLELLFSRHLKAERSEACSEPLIVFVQAITVKGRRKSQGD